MRTLTRRPLKCDGPPPGWVTSALDHAKQAKVLTLALPVRLLDARAPASSSPSSPASPSPAPASRLELLLGRKKRGVGDGYFNGFGGKLEPGESTSDAALRELLEESGLRAREVAHVGALTFVFDDEPERPWQVHVYAVFAWDGGPYETEEMAPRWFGAAGLPFGRMWADDRFWYPRFVEAAEARLLAARERGKAPRAREGEPAEGEAEEEEEDERAADPAGGAPPTVVSSAPWFEGVFGFRGATREMAWAGLWALEGGGGTAGAAAEDDEQERSAVADEAAADDAGSGERVAPATARGSPCPWLPRAPSATGLAPESLAHLARAAELARLTAAAPPTSWKGWAGARDTSTAAAAAAAAVYI